LEGCLITCSVMEIKEKLWKIRQCKDRMEVGDDDMIND
jgi:hypothetical protein